MKIVFEKVKAHGFLSLGDIEVDLKDRGYVLVSGINKCAKDDAKSNGSGKSSIWSAICFALTGETIQGMTSDLVNVNYDGSCYVELEFSVDRDEYKIIRYKAPKVDLKLYINNVDRSGDGIRKTEQILSEYLPDLNSRLISSVIILGQGLPQKFSANSPSGRKEVLEKLSKSDFMIEDIKNRIAERSTTLSNDLRNIQDSLLIKNTKLNGINEDLKIKIAERDNTIKPDFDKLISEKTTLNNTILEELNKLSDADKTLVKSCENALESVTSKTNEKSEKLNGLILQKTTNQADAISKKSKLEADIRILSAEITRLDNIKDVCPTCGQKLVGVEKPDTSKQKEDLVALKEDLYTITKQLNDDNIIFNKAYSDCSSIYDSEIKTLNESYITLKQNKLSNQNLIDSKMKEQRAAQTELNDLIHKKENFENDFNRLCSYISDKQKENAELLKEIEILKQSEHDIEEHISVINKMNTLVKRDFRGFLLKGIIEYIDKKAKEYCSEIFNTDEIGFVLDGNNISITFCNKNFDGLSGGEKQRIDLILQFAIRDMMCNYLGFRSNILVLDEIFDQLDSRSCEKVLNFISNRLRDVNSLFIISHHSDSLSIPSDSELIIEKGEDSVSRIK